MQQRTDFKPSKASTESLYKSTPPKSIHFWFGCLIQLHTAPIYTNPKKKQKKKKAIKPFGEGCVGRGRAENVLFVPLVGNTETGNVNKHLARAHRSHRKQASKHKKTGLALNTRLVKAPKWCDGKVSGLS